ncbi:hypothetical protein BD770DRAFT_425323 [Pilaira anomala]|nr:hypothetical protein BD770DRAFT_425323 [Pilaira anomala]
MEQSDTYYNQTLHYIKSHWESWSEISSDKNYFNYIAYPFVYIMNFCIQAVNKLEALWEYWKYNTINIHEDQEWKYSKVSLYIISGLSSRINFLINLSKCYFTSTFSDDTQDKCFKTNVTDATNLITPLLVTNGEEGSSSILLSGRIAYDEPSTVFSSYIVHKEFNTITDDTNLPGRVRSNSKTTKSHQKFDSFPSKPTENSEVDTELNPHYEPLTHLYQSGLDILFPPEMIARCAISVTSPDKQQRLINFSDRVKKEWITPHQLLETSGEIKCAQIRTGERDCTTGFIISFLTVSLFLNVFYGIYQRRKYKKSQNNNVVRPSSS